MQLTNAQDFFFPEMLIGEACDSLARFGTDCYMVCVAWCRQLHTYV